MTKTTKLLNILKSGILIFCLLFLFAATAQVGIGTTSPASGALLDLDDPNRGLLVPRVTIAVLGTAAPVTAPTTGLLVWNLDVGTGVGFHYWDGAAWVPIGGGATSNDWTLAGNAITGTEFLGTTSNHDLNIRTNNVDRMRVQSNGQTTIGFGAGAANANDQFSSFGTNGVAGYSTAAGIGVRGQNLGSGDAVLGINNSTGNAVYAENKGSGDGVNTVNYGTGKGVYAENFFSNNYSVHAVDGTTSVYGDNTFGAIGVSGVHWGDNIISAGGIGVRAENFWGNNYSMYAVDGFYSVYGDNNIGGDALRGDTNSTISNGVWATNPNAAGTALIGGANGLSIYRTGGSGVAGSGNQVGVFGYAGLGANAVANRGNAAGVFDLDTDADPTTTGTNGTRAIAHLAGFDNVSPNGSLAARNSYYGGYFVGGTISGSPSYAYAGMKYNTNNNGTTGTDYKIIGNGTNSTIIKDRNNTPRILFSPEAPEILFEDYGIGKLVNGTAEIIIDPILKDAIYVDANHPLKVFIQLEGDCNGVYVTNKSANGFTVKELQNGNSNVDFSWHIVANRADTKDASGNVTSKHVGLRLPEGPELLKPKEMIAKKEDVDLASIPLNQKAMSKVKPEKPSNEEVQDVDKEEKDPSKNIELKNREELQKK